MVEDAYRCRRLLEFLKEGKHEKGREGKGREGKEEWRL